MSKIILEEKEVSLLIVGAGEEEQELRNLAQKLNLTSKCIFVGNVPHERILDYYSIVDMLIYPRISRPMKAPKASPIAVVSPQP